MGHQFRDIRGLVADALQVGDHPQRGGDGAQVLGHRLLAQQQIHTAAFDLPFQLVDLPLQGGHLLLGMVGHALQSLGRQGNGLFAQAAHGDQLPVELFQLIVKFVAHQPNLPVM